MDDNALERLAAAFEQIASALTAIAQTNQNRFEREFPTKAKKQASVTHRLSDAEKLARQISGDPSEPLEWIGERELEVIASESSERAGTDSKKS